MDEVAALTVAHVMYCCFSLSGTGTRHYGMERNSTQQTGAVYPSPPQWAASCSRPQQGTTV